MKVVVTAGYGEDRSQEKEQEVSILKMLKCKTSIIGGRRVYRDVYRTE